MFGDYSEDLLRQAIIEIKAGNRESGRRYLDRALYMSSDHEVMAEAWYWMSQASEDAGAKRSALENCLANDLQHARARRALAILDGRLRADEIIDPNMANPAADLRDAGTRRSMCPKCGARMVYAPDGRRLVCEYCLGHQALAPEAAREQGSDFIIAMAKRRGHSQPLHEQVRRCQGCGAEFILPPGALSFSCAYCDSPHVVIVETSTDMIAPDGLLPHMFDQQHAGDLLMDWIQNMQIEPDGPAARPRGLYVPVWSFSFGGFIGYTGETTREEGGLYNGRPPKREPVEGRYPVILGITVAASRRPSAPLVRMIAGFDLKAAQPYDPRYLTGWPAELYDVSMAEASLEARSRAYETLKRDLPVRLEPLRVLSTSSADLSIETFRLDLVPVWLSELFVDGRGGILLINGQSGAVSGDTFKRGRKGKGGMTVWLRDMLHD